MLSKLLMAACLTAGIVCSMRFAFGLVLALDEMRSRAGRCGNWGQWLLTGAIGGIAVGAFWLALMIGDA